MSNKYWYLGILHIIINIIIIIAVLLYYYYHQNLKKL